MYANKESQIGGSGGIAVYDANRSRTTNLIYPFVETGSVKNVFKEFVYQPNVKMYTGEHFNIHKNWQIQNTGLAENADVVATLGQVTSSYGQESPIKRNLTSRQSTITANYYNYVSNTMVTGESRAINGSERTQVSVNLTASALQNVAKKYTVLSNHFLLTGSSIRSRDLVYDDNSINFITIPSMYYGSSIKKGSVELNYYITGSKVASCADTNHNGTLIGTTGSTTGQVVGLVLYDEGIIMLTSSNAIETVDNHGIVYDGSSPITSSWLYYGTTLNDGISTSNTLASASYDLNFKGVNYINSMTMFAHARKGHLNHSNNPTYIGNTKIGSILTGSGTVFAESGHNINNIVSGSFVSASFEKTTYISKVHIYDEDGNLIAITSMAKPIKKTLEDEFTFKMKLDL